MPSNKYDTILQFSVYEIKDRQFNFVV